MWISNLEFSLVIEIHSTGLQKIRYNYICIVCMTLFHWHLLAKIYLQQMLRQVFFWRGVVPSIEQFTILYRQVQTGLFLAFFWPFRETTIFFTWRNPIFLGCVAPSNAQPSPTQLPGGQKEVGGPMEGFSHGFCWGWFATQRKWLSSWVVGWFQDFNDFFVCLGMMSQFD